METIDVVLLGRKTAQRAAVLLGFGLVTGRCYKRFELADRYLCCGKVERAADDDAVRRPFVVEVLPVAKLVGEVKTILAAVRGIEAAHVFAGLNAHEVNSERIAFGG